MAPVAASRPSLALTPGAQEVVAREESARTVVFDNLCLLNRLETVAHRDGLTAFHTFRQAAIQVELHAELRCSSRAAALAEAESCCLGTFALAELRR